MGGGCASSAKPVSFLTPRQASHGAVVARLLSASGLSTTRPTVPVPTSALSARCDLNPADDVSIRIHHARLAASVTDGLDRPGADSPPRLASSLTN